MTTDRTLRTLRLARLAALAEEGSDGREQTDQEGQATAPDSSLPPGSLLDLARRLPRPAYRETRRSRHFAHRPPVGNDSEEQSDGAL